MNPTYLEPVPPPQPKRRPFRALAKAVWAAVGFNVWRLLPGYRPRHHDDAGLVGRALRWLLIRSAAAMTAVLALASGLVYFGTHPTTYASGIDPGSLGLYYERVVLPTPDGLAAEAWLVPVLDARLVLSQKEHALNRPRPVAILLHDFGQTREQMLPLVRPLHDAGIVVLVPAQRSSAGGPATGHTFGIQEANDVAAAIAVIKKRSYVDERQITLIGAGTGGTAALLAAEADASIRAVVVSKPMSTEAEMLAYLGPQDVQIPWLAKICKWAFELSYNVDAEEIDVRHDVEDAGPRVLALKPQDHLDGRTGRQTAAMVADYLVRRLEPHSPSVADIQGN